MSPRPDATEYHDRAFLMKRSSCRLTAMSQGGALTNAMSLGKAVVAHATARSTFTSPPQRCTTTFNA